MQELKVTTLRAMSVEKIESMLKTWMRNGENPIIQSFMPANKDSGLLAEIDAYTLNCNFTKQSLRENSIDSVTTSNNRNSPTR